ncbi:MAG: hypothetical protein HY400_01110, partial [Elusimicrobia bacterium]|nr:hypothetical protein [Elusimicrobiota bacterium]
DWIRDHFLEIFSEMKLLLKQIVPVGYHAEKHFSASYQEAIGTIYMSLHPNTLVMAEALVHEFQHNKLNLLSYQNPILHNAFSPLYPSPVRPDPRPLWGILMAVHAFLPVAVFYRKLKQAGHPVSLTPDFKRRLNEIDRQNQEGMDVLRAHADWTVLGQNIMEELETLDAQHMSEREMPFIRNESKGE